MHDAELVTAHPHHTQAQAVPLTGFTRHLQDVNPVQYSILSSEDSADIGYVRVIVFSENTAAGVYSAVQDLAVRICS